MGNFKVYTTFNKSLGQTAASAWKWLKTQIRGPFFSLVIIITVPVEGILEWHGHCRRHRQCIEAHSDGLSVRSAEKNSSPSFFCCLDFCFPCRPWYNRTKEVYTEGLLWKNESGRQLVRKFQDETWAAGRFELHACTTFTSIECHYMGATPPRLYSPCPLIVRRPKSGTAKTVPAVPAALALNYYMIHKGYKK